MIALGTSSGQASFLYIPGVNRSQSHGIITLHIFQTMLCIILAILSFSILDSFTHTRKHMEKVSWHVICQSFWGHALRLLALFVIVSWLGEMWFCCPDFLLSLWKPTVYEELLVSTVTASRVRNNAFTAALFTDEYRGVRGSPPLWGELSLPERPHSLPNSLFWPAGHKGKFASGTGNKLLATCCVRHWCRCHCPCRNTIKWQDICLGKLGLLSHRHTLVVETTAQDCRR